MSTQHQPFLHIKENINADSVIGFTSFKDWKAGKYADSTTLSAYFANEKKHEVYLGLLNMFETTEHTSFPLMKDMFKNAAVLEIEPGQSVTYDLKVNREADKCLVTADTSTQTDKPGIEETIFDIVLNKLYQKGDVLAYDAQKGAQIVVHNDYDPQPFGESWRHTVVLASNSKAKWFPPAKLKPGVEYFKIGHVIGENEIDYSAIDFNEPASGSLRCEFLIGDPRGVETYYTERAANMRNQTMEALGKQVGQKALDKLEGLGGKDTMFIAAKGSLRTGLNPKGALVGSVLEYLVLAEIMKLEAYSLAFARGATISTTNGIKRITEGLYHQQRRGKIFKYAKPGGITMDLIEAASKYIFRNNPMKADQRVIRFRCGQLAYSNMEQLFREYFKTQVDAAHPSVWGTDAKLSGKLISGDINKGLTVSPVRYSGVTVPGIGTIEIEHDPSMDFEPFTDRFQRGFFGNGYARTSYSMVIEDVTNPSNSNVTQKVSGATLVEGGNKNANIYYIQPEGGSLTYGFEQGRMANGDQRTYVQSSLKAAARTFWAKSQSGVLMLDTTRYLCIELQDENEF